MAIALKSIGNSSADEELRKAGLLNGILGNREQVELASKLVAAASDKYNSAVSMLHQGKQSDATAAFQAAIRLNPDMPEPTLPWALY